MIGFVELFILAIPIITSIALIIAGAIWMSRRKREGKSITGGVVTLILGVVLLPLFGGVVVVMLLVRTSADYSADYIDTTVPPAVDACRPGDPCEVLTKALSALARDEIDSFRNAFLPADRKWVDELPQVTGAPALQSRLVSETLMGGDPHHLSIEDLQRMSGCHFRFLRSQTALDGLSSTLRFTRICSNSSTIGSIRAVRYEDTWMLERPPS